VQATKDQTIAIVCELAMNNPSACGLLAKEGGRVYSEILAYSLHN
jgi:hypothetical protein